MWKILTATSTAIVLLSTSVLADSANLDTNGDSFIDQNEFDAAINDNGLYASWDTDQSGTLSQDEYEEGVFDQFDSNDDDAWDGNEYSAYESSDFGIYTAWDADENGVLSQDEFDNALYDIYDANGDDQWNDAEFSEAEDDGWFDF